MKFLVVDDSSFTQIMTSNLLKKFFPNGDIITARDGFEGLEKYKEAKPDYIFVDLLMPKLNGIDEDAKIFVITADVQKSIKEETEALDIKAFISKPFNEDKGKYVFNIIKDDLNE